MRSNSLRFITCCLAVLLLGTVAGAESSEGADLAQLSPAQKLQLRRTPVVRVFEQCKDAVVNISSTQIVQMRSFGFDPFFDDFFDFPGPGRVRQYKQTSVGSGFVLHPDGYIVTNAHVVARTAERKVIFANKREFDAQVIAMDTQRDLAVLKIETEQPLHALPLGTSSDLMIGETTIAIGNPLGYEHTVTAGVVSAVNRSLEAGNGVEFKGLIQTDASINPGNSGGPLLNILGELIGVNTAIRADAQNIGFAIPVDQLRALLPELLDVERRYRLVTGLKVRQDKGCIVASVAPNTPASDGKLLVGDRIVRINDTSIDSDLDYHIAMLGRKAGEKLTLGVQRNGAEHTLTLAIAERPRPDGDKLLRQKFGLTAQVLDKRTAQQLGFRTPVGLSVTKVEPNSSAAELGIARGDIIIQIDRHHPTNLDDVGELLDQLKPGQAVPISVLRVDGRTITRFNVRILVQK